MSPLRILIILDEGDTELGRLATALADLGHQVRVVSPIVATDLLGADGERFDAVLQAPAASLAEPAPLDDAEKRHIGEVLRHTRGNKRQAAHLLGIARSTLLAKVRKYGL